MLSRLLYENQMGLRGALLHVLRKKYRKDIEFLEICVKISLKFCTNIRFCFQMFGVEVWRNSIQRTQNSDTLVPQVLSRISISIRRFSEIFRIKFCRKLVCKTHPIPGISYFKFHYEVLMWIKPGSNRVQLKLLFILDLKQTWNSDKFCD